jgi:hypothetical protein
MSMMMLQELYFKALLVIYLLRFLIPAAVSLCIQMSSCEASFELQDPSSSARCGMSKVCVNLRRVLRRPLMQRRE